MFKRIFKSLLNLVGYEIRKNTPPPSQIGSPASTSSMSIELLKFSNEELASVANFRTDRYYWLNEYRWRLLMQTGIPIAGSTIFEPGAGIGDQTEFLLKRGASKVIVSEGRETNLEIIRKRFDGNPRVVPLLGDLEECLDRPEFQVHADLVFMWGVYYHIYDSLPEFLILKKLARIAPVVVLDYQESLTGADYIESYSYENTSASISHQSWRQTRNSMVAGVRSAFGYAYFPIEQMNWNDPSCINTPRRIIIGSKFPLNYPGIIEAK
jgi:hypothetical protein